MRSPRKPITSRFVHSDAVLGLAAAAVLLAVAAVVLNVIGGGI